MSFENKSFNRLRILLIITAILFGFLQIYSVSRILTCEDPDGIAYADMADAFLQGDWKSVINPLWSPLYPFFLSIGFYIFKPSPYNELAVVHIVNFITYLLTLFCFDYFINRLILFNQNLATKSDEEFTFISKEGILIFGYSLFIFSALILIVLWGAGPDTCVSAIIYLASAILLKIYTKKSKWYNFVFLGVVLGIGYLLKAPLFPISLIYIGLSVFAQSDIKQNLMKASLGLICFIFISSSLITALSLRQGYLTFSESPKLNYAWYINKIPLFVHWQGENPLYGKPKHPTRKIFNSPPVYEFGEPVGGTYPPWFDPSYWHEGLVVHFKPLSMIHTAAGSLSFYYTIFLNQLIFLIPGFFVLLLMSTRTNLYLKDLSKYSLLIFPSVFAFIMFSLVHLEPRYIGGFVVLFILGLFLALRLPKNKFSEQLTEYTITILSILVLMTTGSLIGKGLANSLKAEHKNTELTVAKSLNKIGIQKGDKVAIIGYAIPRLPYWARLARVKIAAEILEKDSKYFWTQNELTKARIIQLFTNTGAKVIVAKEIPVCCTKNNWQKIDDTPCYIYKLFKQEVKTIHELSLPLKITTNSTQ